MRNRWQLALFAVGLAIMALLGWAPGVLAYAVAGITLDEIATTAVTDVTETFKRVYLMAVDAVPDATALTAQLNRTRKFKAGPDGLYFNVKMETGGRVANVPDGLLLPRASRPKRKTGKVGLTHTYTVVAIGGQSIPLTSDTRNAFVSNLEEQLEDGLERVKLNLEQQYNGKGTGILCVIETIAGAPVYDVQNPYGMANAGPGTMLLIEGMDIATINPAGGAERGRGTINTIDPDLEKMTTAAAIAGTVIGDYVVLCNDVGATGTDKASNYGNEAPGISAWCASGDTFENIDGTAYRRWNASVLANGGTARRISEKLIAQLEARIQAKSGVKPDLFYTTRGISIELQDQLAGLRRFNGETTTLKGGYEGVKIGSRTVLEGDFCPKGRFHALSTKPEHIGMADLVKMGYVDLDGAKLHRVEGRHAYRADLWIPHQPMVFRRNAFGKLEDLIDDNTIVR